MDHTLRLLMILLVHRASAEPLKEALQRRSDAFVMYANDYAADYEPITYAALSLHNPMPVLHIVSQTPLQAPYSALASTLAHSYAPYPAAAASNTVLYARPDKYGGYSYYRKRYGPKRVNKKRTRPVLLRIHKYRVIRDR